MQEENNTIAVSYTHLDVYKRQETLNYLQKLYTAYFVLRYFRSPAAAGYIVRIVDNISPVSYTHLDVYKRQVERREDIPLLTQYFIDHYNKAFDLKVKGVSTEVMKIFSEYNWPENIRELRHTIEHAMNLVENETRCV